MKRPNTFPGGSKERVSRAGAAVRDRTASNEDLAVIEEWRAAHRAVLNTFQAILRNRTRDQGIIVAQRHKRRRTIVDKLRRFPTMQLARMDDVAGCRLIFPDIATLRAFRVRFHQARFGHKRKNDASKYDYIENPKYSGYRGIHDVYEYNVNSESGRPLKGLLMELQYRTIYQHAWATCVEIVGFITENQPKFDRGDNRFQRILMLSSEIIARAFEGRNSCLGQMTDEEVVREFVSIDADLNFMSMLRNLNKANREIAGNRNTILIYSGDDDLEVRTYRDATEALAALFDLEAEMPGKDVVLVRADRSEDVQIAFKNYFSDAREFIKFIDDGCQILLGPKVLTAPDDYPFDADEELEQEDLD